MWPCHPAVYRFVTPLFGHDTDRVAGMGYSLFRGRTVVIWGVVAQEEAGE